MLNHKAVKVKHPDAGGLSKKRRYSTITGGWRWPEL